MFVCCLFVCCLFVCCLFVCLFVVCLLFVCTCYVYLYLIVVWNSAIICGRSMDKPCPLFEIVHPAEPESGLENAPIGVVTRLGLIIPIPGRALAATLLAARCGACLEECVMAGGCVNWSDKATAIVCEGRASKIEEARHRLAAQLLRRKSARPNFVSKQRQHFLLGAPASQQKTNRVGSGLR
jgi:hypothetical protein